MIFTMGIIGWGGMGHYHEKIAREKLTRLQTKGAYDIDPAKKPDILSHGLIAYDTAEDLIRDPEIDLVVITTPNDSHKDYSIRALKAGKHVLCEKPVMMNGAELEEVLAVAKETGKIFTVHQQRRWDRDFLIVKDVLRSGVIGKPFFIESRVNGARGIPDDWRCYKATGGGLVLDWGVHLIDQLLTLIDSPVTEIYAQVLNLKYEEVDDNFKMMLRYANGMGALIEVGTCHFIPQPRWYVNGGAGTLVIKDWASGADIVQELESDMQWEHGVVHTAAGPTRTMAARPEDSTVESHIDILPHTCNYLLQEQLLDAMESGDYSKVAVQPDHLRRSMKVMEAAFRSSAEGVLIKENI